MLAKTSVKVLDEIRQTIVRYFGLVRPLFSFILQQLLKLSLLDLKAIMESRSCSKEDTLVGPILAFRQILHFLFKCLYAFDDSTDIFKQFRLNLLKFLMHLLRSQEFLH